jgi:hypothetical protein
MNREQELEVERLAYLREAEETFEGSDLQERFGPGSFGHHEAVDRSYIVSEMWNFVLTSPATIIDPKAFELASKINDLMFDFYQLMARRDWEKEEADAKKKEEEN